MLPQLASDPKTTEGNRSLYQVINQDSVVSANAHTIVVGAHYVFLQFLLN